MKKLRGAIIGCGAISEFHLRGWGRIPEVEICALADPDFVRAEERRAHYAPAARIYDGLESLLAAESVDFVDIITPPWLHREHCLRAATANLHIVCQKPLCDDPEEARALVAELKNHPRCFVVHENHRYRQWFRDLIRLTHEGFFGKVRHVELVQHDPREPPQKINTEAEHGVLLQYGVHLLDMMVALLGEPTQVHSNLHRLNPRVRGESLAQVVCDYPDATATVNVSWKGVGVQQGHALVIGDLGEAYYEGTMTRGPSARLRVCEGSRVVRDEQRSPTDDYVNSFFQLERDFVDSVLHGTSSPPSAAENLRSLKIAFAAYEAARSGKPVKLTPVESFPRITAAKNAP